MVNEKVKKAGFDIGTVGAVEPAPSLATLIGQKAPDPESFYNIEKVPKTICFPASWWDHVKQDLFPTWAKLRWPPAMTEVHYWEYIVKPEVWLESV